MVRSRQDPDTDKKIDFSHAHCRHNCADLRRADALNILAGIVDIIFPPRCFVCGGYLHVQSPLCLCDKCMNEVSFIISPLCPRCGLPFSIEKDHDHLCGGCLLEDRPYAVARSVCRYEGTILKAVHKFKYQGKTGIGKALGNVMADFASGIWKMGTFDMVMPVPLHIRRLRERGFNQSVILARQLSRRFHIPLDFSSLKRVRFTPSQVGMGRKERAVNVMGAFALTKHSDIVGKKILLVDDVYTTGSTLIECSQVLIDSGAAAVAVLTMARAIGEHLSEEMQE